jgi:hypothetical protein
MCKVFVGKAIEDVGSSGKDISPTCGWHRGLKKQGRVKLLAVQSMCSALPFCGEV